MSEPSLLRRRAVVLALVIGFPVSAFFLVLAFREASLGEVWEGVRGADPGLLAVAVLVIGCVYTAQAERWRRIADESATFTRFLRWVVASVAVNNVVPARAGDLLRGRWVSSAAGWSTGRGVSTVVVDRAFDLLGLVLLLAVGIPRVVKEGWSTRVGIAGVVVFVLVLAFLAGARMYARRRSRDRRTRGRARKLVRDTLDGLAVPIRPRRLTELATLSLLAWGLWAFAAWLVARSVGVDLGALDVMFVAAVINLGVAIPSSPGFVGTYQWLAVSALELLDIAKEPALTFAILMQAVWYIPTTLVGGIVLVLAALRRVRPGAA